MAALSLVCSTAAGCNGDSLALVVNDVGDVSCATEFDDNDD